MSVKHVDEIEKIGIETGSGVTKQVVISPDEGPNFAMRRFSIEPGGGMPKHTNQVEHEQYVLRGEAEIAIGDEIYRVKEGDVVYIPANLPHWYKNHGEEAFVFLCIVPNKPDNINVLEE